MGRGQVLGQNNRNKQGQDREEDNLASTYQSQGRLEEAEELFVQVVEAQKRVLGQEHPETLISNLSSTYYGQGRSKKAEELCVQVVEARKRVLGQDQLICIFNWARIREEM